MAGANRPPVVSELPAEIEEWPELERLAFEKETVGFFLTGHPLEGVMDDMRRTGQVSVELLNASAGFLISPFDLPGVAVLISAGRRVAAVWKPAALGACIGILLRTLGHALVA